MMAIKLLVAGVIFFSVVGFYAFYISPTLGLQEAQIDEMEDAKVKLHQLEGEILSLESAVAALRVKQGVSDDRLFLGSELIQMNKNINQFAAESNVRILSMQMGQKQKLEKSEDAGFDGESDMPIDDGSDMPIDDGSDMPIDDGSVDSEEVKLFEIPIDFKIRGGYLDYLTFRSQLASWGKAINIQRETITAGEGRYRGIVTVAGAFRVVQKMKAKRES